MQESSGQRREGGQLLGSEPSVPYDSGRTAHRAATGWRMIVLCFSGAERVGSLR